MGIPKVDPNVHKSLDTIYPVVRDQTIYLVEQFADLDKTLDMK